MDTRLKLFQKTLNAQNLDGFIVTNPINIYYLSGFRGISQTERESYLVFNPKPTIIVPRLYQKEAAQLKSKSLKIKVVAERNELLQTINILLSKCKKVGFESENLTYGEHNKIKNGLKLAPYQNLVEKLRVVKNADEIAKIEKAQIISQKAFNQLIKSLKVGQTEDEISHLLSTILKSLGGQGLAFESIIASGPNSGFPHHQTGARKIKSGEILLLDFGAKYQNYHADLSRTIFTGRAKDMHKNIYMHVKKAQENAIGKITKNIKSSSVFRLANEHFEKNRLDEYFLHGLGHGIGLEIHEPPYLRKSKDDQQDLKEGMVFSIEPGLYFPWGGVRIEDLVVIKNGKAQVLGKTAEEIIEIQA